MKMVTIEETRNSGQKLKQGRDLEVGANAEAVEGCCFLTYLPWLAEPTFL